MGKRRVDWSTALGTGSIATGLAMLVLLVFGEPAQVVGAVFGWPFVVLGIAGFDRLLGGRVGRACARCGRAPHPPRLHVNCLQYVEPAPWWMRVLTRVLRGVR